jgi:DnaJ-domain-containing protein 1
MFIKSLVIVSKGFPRLKGIPAQRSDGPGHVACNSVLIPQRLPKLADLYAVLGVTSAASPSEIKEAYHSGIRLAHPDRAGDTASAAKLNQAFAILANAEARTAYDQGQRHAQSDSNQLA